MVLRCIFGYAHISDQIFSVFYVEVFSARPGVKLNFWIQELVDRASQVMDVIESKLVQCFACLTLDRLTLILNCYGNSIKR